MDAVGTNGVRIRIHHESTYNDSDIKFLYTEKSHEMQASLITVKKL